jgi:hypothetical protein
MSGLDENINKAKEIYYKILYLEQGINNDSEINLKDNYSAIIGIIKNYGKSLKLLVLPNIDFSEEILQYYTKSLRKLIEMETHMEKYISDKEILRRHNVKLQDNKKQKKSIIPGILDPITLEVISNGQTIAYLIDESNRALMNRTNNPPPPPFIYDENINGIRALILSSQHPKNPITREKIQEIHLYTAEVPDLHESAKKGGRRKTIRKTKNKRKKTIKRRKIVRKQKDNNSFNK